MTATEIIKFEIWFINKNLVSVYSWNSEVNTHHIWVAMSLISKKTEILVSTSIQFIEFYRAEFSVAFYNIGNTIAS